MAVDSALLRPVVDPALEEEERELLAGAGAGLIPAAEPLPAAPRRGGRTSTDVLLALPVATLCGFLPVVALPLLLGRRAGAVTGALAQAGVVAAWWWGGLTPFLITVTALQCVSWLLIYVFGCGMDEAQRLARLHHGHYYVDEDFGTSVLRPLVGRSLRRQMLRTQIAVTTVLESEVNKAGLLDDVANAVTLPVQEWEIAQVLAELTRLATQVRSVTGNTTASPRVLEVLEPQKRALQLSAEALEERVEALERYAEHVRAADEAYRDWQAVQELEELGDDMAELLARTVRDELAVAEIEGLADRARLEALQRSLGEARQAGLDLAGDGDHASGGTR
ncbi:hypothetical protein C3489_19260 [Streptomyces sp. Ru71]|uniref:hypothetical protein n=1 Tax=Streptomyces sp. Ru71 TaxID=2080746 RepID=UPI000CDD7551|nr:hypothetical protein [Streptomyces sp. Ru71]POX51848.1 hypothetical protein C3489_19260 [Streptomyces sp. Ru71]